MLLKYCTKKLKSEKRLLGQANDLSYTIESVGDDYVLTVETKTPHLLKNNDLVFIKRKIKEFNKVSDLLNMVYNNNCIVYVKEEETIDKVDYQAGYYIVGNNKCKYIESNEVEIYLKKYNSLGDELHVTIYEDNPNKFSIVLKKYQNIITQSVTDLDTESLFKFSGGLPVLLYSGNEIILYKPTYKYNYISNIIPGDNYIILSEIPSDLTQYKGYDYIVVYKAETNTNNVYKWELDYTLIHCNYIDEYTLSYKPWNDNVYLFENELLKVIDERFINFKTNEYTLNLYDDIEIYEQREYYNFSFPLSGTPDIGLNDESTLSMYFEERKMNSIINANDYERQCFVPYVKINNKEELNFVNKITYNLFLRDRSADEGLNEEWNTSDDKGWNQYKIDENGNYMPQETYTNGDLVNVLGFTDNDIYYRKKKVEKTFIRLSFYDSKDPFKQMLLFYSTIFLDSGDLYTKYIKNIQNNENANIPIVEQPNFGDNNLTLSFSVMDRFNHDKSSEGFYMYLFPDGVKHDMDTNDETERVIYLKVELNNAANGKSVPLIFPNNDFNSVDFPLSLVDEETGDISKLYDYMFIPITIKYDRSAKEYIYYFNNIQLNDDNNQASEISINLYEPKINSHGSYQKENML